MENTRRDKGRTLYFDAAKTKTRTADGLLLS